jgi:hypothetical protein
MTITEEDLRKAIIEATEEVIRDNKELIIRLAKDSLRKKGIAPDGETLPELP